MTKQELDEKHETLLTVYREALARHTNTSRQTKTTLRERELRGIESSLIDYVDMLGYILETGGVPFGREVARVLYPIPAYEVPAHVLKTASKGISICLRSGQLALTLVSEEDETAEREEV